jgi:V8-like Glu-specific endopeptidase
MKNVVVGLSVLGLLGLSGCDDDIRVDVDIDEGVEEDVPVPAVFNGTNISASEYPSVGMIVDYTNFSTGSFGLCSGTLISPRIVLTAAHCVDDAAPAQLRFTLNAAPTFGNPNASFFVSVTDKIVHPAWQDVFGSFGDVALIELATPQAVAFPELWNNQAPLALGAVGPSASQMTLVGYGNNATPDSGYGRKRKGTISFYAWTDLVNYYSAPREFMDYDAGPTGQQSCSGDSGGPAFYRYQNADHLISVVHGGPVGCDSSNSFFVDVSLKRQWILAKQQQLIGIFGDINADGSLNVIDINAFSSDLRTSGHPRSDLDNDGVVGQLDADILIRNAVGTYPGDTDLDGDVDGADFVVIQKFMSATGAGWQMGDFNFDAVIDATDMNLWRANFGNVGALAAAQ